MEKPYKVILFYKFVDIENREALKKEQLELCSSIGLKGRLLIAKEGINGTFEGTPEQIEQYKKAIHSNPLFSSIVFKESEGDGKAFTKLKIKVRDEVVTLGGNIDLSKTAKEITAEELETLYEKKEDFVVLDLRNDFEIEVGCFDKTYDPKLENFRDLPSKLQELEHLKDKKVVAVCTGGIRCEKATCLLNEVGFKDLYQLKDGIHTYIQKFPGKRFRGSLFVFDNRMTSPIVDTPEREIVGKCIFCKKPCEEFFSDDSNRPSKKVICCSKCAEGKVNLRKPLPNN